MHKLFRVHGDNIVECERVIAYIKQSAVVRSFKKSLSSLSCLLVDLDFEYEGDRHHWRIEMFPGFSRDTQSPRWRADIFNPIRSNGSFLDETPDAIVTIVEGGRETILFAIEFCSALQAGNQAWQRSGRAYSVGRAGCPYIYVVDFVKYELNPNTRERKDLRFPNPAVPFSYISFSKQTGNFVAQAYIKAEEFDAANNIFEFFNEEWFSEKLISDFIIQKMLGKPTTQIELNIFNNNFNIVKFIASRRKDNNSLSLLDWQAIYDTDVGILEYSKNMLNHFSFAKKISHKSQLQLGKIEELAAAIKEMSIGVAKNDLPFGIMPSNRAPDFVNKLKEIYPALASDFDILKSIGEDYIICMLKGFKPKGDDNRPDRGVLPLVAMLTSERVYVLTCIYGPIKNDNYRLLVSDPNRLSERNGLWQAFLSLSDFILLDAPLLPTRGIINAFIDNRKTKQKFLARKPASDFSLPAVPSEPTSYREDDVDTLLHYVFSHLLTRHAFVCMCNPPGGDWSGLSVLLGGQECRWLSLPRVSASGAKRPDHLAELFVPNNKPILLVIESKERCNDLETDIGEKLIGYISWLMEFQPSVIRTGTCDWRTTEEIISENSFEILSVAAYLSQNVHGIQQIFNKTKCDLLFVFTPNVKLGFWKINVIANCTSAMAEVVKQFLLHKLGKKESTEIILTTQNTDEKV